MIECGQEGTFSHDSRGLIGQLPNMSLFWRNNSLAFNQGIKNGVDFVALILGSASLTTTKGTRHFLISMWNGKFDDEECA